MKKITLLLSLVFLSLGFLSAQCDGQLGSGDVFKVVPEMPSFPGCGHIEDLQERRDCSSQKLFDFVYSNLHYPVEAYENNIEGLRVIEFIVEKTGCLSSFEILYELDDDISNEVLRIFEILQTQNCIWSPGRMENGDTVRVVSNFPVRFRINSDTQVHSDSTVQYSCDGEIISNIANETLCEELKIFPNPTKDLVKIILPERIASDYLEILNMEGKLVKQIKIPQSIPVINLSLNDLYLESSEYIFRIKGVNSIAQTKVVFSK